MAYSPIVIDELLRRVHSHLSAEDECYSMMVYTSHRGYTYSVENSLISNFKKGLDLKGTAQWTYKGREIGKLLKDILPISRIHIHYHLKFSSSNVRGRSIRQQRKQRGYLDHSFYQTGD